MMRVSGTEAQNRFGSLCAPGERPMVQYDVFPNPSSSAASGIPYAVVIHGDLLDALHARLTMPLAVLDLAGKAPALLSGV